MWRSLLVALSLTVASPALAESTEATMIPIAPQITDASGAVWTLRWSDNAVLKNGAPTGTTGVLEVWYLNHQVWSFDGQAWRMQASVTWPQNPGLPATAGLRTPVGPQTGVACTGVNLTSTSNIQAAVDAAPAGTTFCLAAGTYTNASVVPKAGDQFIGSWDGTNGTILDGTNTTVHAFAGDNTKDHVVLKNLIVKNYNTPTQDASVFLWGPYSLIQWCDISLSQSGAGVWLGTHGLLLANKIHHNAQEGYKLVYDGGASQPAVGTIFDSNEINNNDPTSVGWDGSEQGGGKAVSTQYATFWYNFTHDNFGSGMWTDYDNIFTIYWYNKSLNDSAGIEHEISFNASFIGNDIRGNGSKTVDSWCPTSFVACNCFQIENSGGVMRGPNAGMIEISNNICMPGQFGRALIFREQDRGAADNYSLSPYWVANLSIHHNTFDLSGGINDTQVGGAVDIQDLHVWYPEVNILWDFNTYTLGSRGLFQWGRVPVGTLPQNFTAWQAQGQDVHGTAH